MFPDQQKAVKTCKCMDYIYTPREFLKPERLF